MENNLLTTIPEVISERYSCSNAEDNTLSQSSFLKLNIKPNPSEYSLLEMLISPKYNPASLDRNIEEDLNILYNKRSGNNKKSGDSDGNRQHITMFNNFIAGANGLNKDNKSKFSLTPPRSKVISDSAYQNSSGVTKLNADKIRWQHTSDNQPKSIKNLTTTRTKVNQASASEFKQLYNNIELALHRDAIDNAKRYLYRSIGFNNNSRNGNNAKVTPEPYDIYLKSLGNLGGSSLEYRLDSSKQYLPINSSHAKSSKDQLCSSVKLAESSSNDAGVICHIEYKEYSPRALEELNGAESLESCNVDGDDLPKCQGNNNKQSNPSSLLSAYTRDSYSNNKASHEVAVKNLSYAEVRVEIVNDSDDARASNNKVFYPKPVQRASFSKLVRLSGDVEEFEYSESGTPQNTVNLANCSSLGGFLQEVGRFFGLSQ